MTDSDKKQIYRRHGDGIDDPNLVLEYDPRFEGTLGTSINRRDFLKAGTLAGLAGGMGMGMPKPGFAQDKPFNPEVKIGYIPITDAAALLVAHEEGFFKEVGIPSKKPTLIRGWSTLVEAFSSHRFNLTHMLIPIPIWMRYNNNAKVKITAWDHTNGSAIVVSRRSGINAPEDFGGKQIAMPYWYSIHNIVSQKLLRKAGIKPVIRPQNAKLASDECNFMVLPPPDMAPALAAGTIDGYCVAEPFNALGELKAGGKVLRFTGDIWKGHPCCVVVMHEQDAMDPDRAAWAQGVHNAIVGAQMHLGKNRKAMAEMLSKEGKGYLPYKKDVIERAMLFYDPAYYNNPAAIQHPEWGIDRINFEGWPYASATDQVTSFLKETKVTSDNSFLNDLTPQHVHKDLVQYDYVKNALENHPDWKKQWMESPTVPDENPYTRVEVIEP
ncbi:MAG TPA: ABC transporter substrate-binding protein [Gammaproteobacteria bacterium]|nr:ABC transporter substrate-binding protein [Gammaproteobacteria bacterium]